MTTPTIENLTVHQQRALNQLRVLTDGADDDVAISVLDNVDWDVQVWIVSRRSFPIAEFLAEGSRTDF
jgi:hypothetical protein